MGLKYVEKTAMDESDYRSAVVISFGDKSLSFYDGEPEDANLSRDFSDIYHISSLIDLAYEAGKKGEEIEFIYETVSWDEI